MPTGYTAKLYDGQDQSFEEFVLSCARAFAAWTRDTSGDSLPEAPESTHAKTWLAKREEDLRHLLMLTPAEVTAEHQAEMTKVAKLNEEQTKKDTTLKARYQKMLDKVEAWTPPSDTHLGLKNFMREQLIDSMNADCRPFEYKVEPDETKWHQHRLDHARKSVWRAQEEAQKERERNERNKLWVQQLHESLGVGVTK